MPDSPEVSLPKHIQISPPEELDSFYAEGNATPSSPTPAAPVAVRPSPTVIPPEPAEVDLAQAVAAPDPAFMTPTLSEDEPTVVPDVPPDGPPPDPEAATWDEAPAPQEASKVELPPEAVPHAPPAVAPTNSIVAALLSFFFPGAGQLYLGQTTKGIILLVVMLVTCWGIGILPWVAALDAYLISQKRNRGETVGDFDFF